MFVKNKWGDFVSISLAKYIKSSGSIVWCDFLDEEIMLFTGTEEQCQKYMAELEKELAAFGKMVRVEIAEKCTCGNSGKAVWEHDKSCVIWEDDSG